MKKPSGSFAASATADREKLERFGPGLGVLVDDLVRVGDSRWRSGSQPAEVEQVFVAATATCVFLVNKPAFNILEDLSARNANP